MNSFSLKAGPEHDRRVVQFLLPSKKGKRLLVAVSGGADSAIMLYALCKFNKDFDLQHEFYPVTVDKADGARVHSANVISWIEKKLDIKINPPIIGGNQDLSHDKITNDFIFKVKDQEKFDCIYIGENAIPPIPFPFDEQNDFPGLAPVRKDNPFKIKSVDRFLPFDGLYKTHTISLYYELGIPELLEYTHTCTEQAIGNCGKCWQCSERRWAFRELGKIDHQAI
jgi:hypothetical protein